MESGRRDAAIGMAIAQRGRAWADWRDLPQPQRRRIGRWAACLGLLMLLFIQPLTRLVMYATHRDLHSHTVLVPLITAYLLYINRKRLPDTYCSSTPGTLIFSAIGFAALAVQWRETLSFNDELAAMVLSFISLVTATGFLFFGSRWMAAAAFPFGFLIFMAPLPDAAVDWLERQSMLASADAAAWYFSLSGTSFVRHGTIFELPGIALQVAQECSGIRSSWVLFITSILASHLFLRTSWRRIALVAFVIPLGILRNGFRVLVIGLLCLQFGRHMIDSVIHRQGGPFFFVLSLVPLFLLLWWFRREEQRLAALRQTP